MLMVPTYFAVLVVNSAFQNSLQVLVLAVVSLGCFEELCIPHHRHDLFRGLPTESRFQWLDHIQPLCINMCLSSSPLEHPFHEEGHHGKDEQPGVLPQEG